MVQLVILAHFVARELGPVWTGAAVLLAGCLALCLVLVDRDVHGRP